MNVLVIGGGGREHALCWALARSPRATRIFCAPGNAGTASIATNLDVKADDVEALLAAAREHAIDVTVVGPEAALVAGVVNRFRAEGLRIFGPTREAARIEWSKAFSKELMARAGVPTAAFGVFDDAEAAKAYIRAQGAPIVVKADGLAAGKGVVVAQGEEEALAAVDAMMTNRAFGEAGARLVVEACLTGQEVSVFAFTDGTRVSPLVAACDYKRVRDGDRGPNTGGMGGYSPPPFWDAALEERIRTTCIEPVVAELARTGAPYSGVLYGGIILTLDGPQVLEFNARFGDPETQLILPRLENDLLDVVDAVLDGRLDALDLRWSEDAAIGVVLASAGYPGPFESGKVVGNLETLPAGVLTFHAGTGLRDGQVVTAGGRVLMVVGLHADAKQARRLAYRAANEVFYDGKMHRTDIAAFAR
jgi:phosphoribosylamine--glycine ligase